MATFDDVKLGGWAAAKVVGVNYYRLDRWIRTDLLPRPTIPARGKGSHRGFSFLDLLRARTVARLRAEGVSLQAIRAVLVELTDRYRVSDPLADTAALVVAGGRIFWAINDAILLDVLRRQLAARPLVVVDMAEVVAEVREGLKTWAA